MKRTALIFLIVVCGPSLVLAWLAYRSVRDQQFVIERQQAVVLSTAAEALAHDVDLYVSELIRGFHLEVEKALLDRPPRELAATFDEALPPRWPLADVGFAVALNGDILSPAPTAAREEARQFRTENELFLANRQSVPVFSNLEPTPADTVSNAPASSDASLLSAMSARYGLRPTPQPGPQRQVEPQQQAVAPYSQRLAPAANNSRSVVTEAEFRQLVGDARQGSVARFIQNRLHLIFWARSDRDPTIVFGASINLQRLIEELRPLIRADESREKPETCLALLDDTAHPVALSRPGFRASWKRPFVAAEVGEVLPHWEVAIYLVDPGWSGRYARTVVLTLVPTIALLAFAIVAGAWVMVRELQREVAVARQKTDFVSNVSHELKTPLTSIRMFAELLADGRVSNPARQRDYLGIITAEAARLTRLINNVLDFSRMERGQKKYDRQPCDLPALVRETVEVLRPHLEQNGYACELDLPQVPLTVHADRDALAQVLLNLLSNAEKYGGDARLIRIELQRVDQPLPHAELRVLDRGLGVPAECREKVFDQFYRAHDALSSGIQGSGLGLTLARQIARAHGGDIDCEPRDGGGTCFRLRLPLPPQDDST